MRNDLFLEASHDPNRGRARMVMQFLLAPEEGFMDQHSWTSAETVLSLEAEAQYMSKNAYDWFMS